MWLSGHIWEGATQGRFPIFYPLYLQSCLRCTECLLRHYLMTFLNQSQDKMLWLTLFNQGDTKDGEGEGPVWEAKQGTALPTCLWNMLPEHSFEYMQHRYLKPPLWPPTEYLFPTPSISTHLEFYVISYCFNQTQYRITWEWSIPTGALPYHQDDFVP